MILLLKRMFYDFLEIVRLIFRTLFPKGSFKSNFKTGRYLFVFCLFLLYSTSGFSQTTGDYRSNVASGNWGAAASWEVFDGVSWVAAGNYPGQVAGAGVVTIRDGHVITMNIASLAEPIGALTVGDGISGSLITNNGNRTMTVTNDIIVNTGATFNLSRFILTVNGNTVINGTLSDNNNNGSATFNGSFTINNGGTFSTNNTSAFTFTGGIVNDGTFNKTGAGAVTFSGSDQELSGSQTIVLNGIVTVTDIVLTNNATVNLTRTTASSFMGTGTWLQGSTGVLNFSGTNIDVDNFDFSSAGNTVNFMRAGVQDIPATIYHHLMLSTSGVKSLLGDITVNGNLSLDGTVSLNCDVNQITGNATGTFSMVNGTSLLLGNTASAVNVLFPTNFIKANISFAGTSTVAYQNNDIQTISGEPDYRNLTISNGGVKTLASSANVLGNLTVTAGEFNLGTVATELNVSGTTSLTGNLVFNGTTAKTVTLSGNLSGAGTIDMSGGSLLHELELGGATNAIGGITTAAVASVINYIGAAQQVIASPNYRTIIFSGTGTKTLQGEVIAADELLIEAGATVNPAAQNFTVSGNSTIAGTFADGTLAGITTLNDVNLSGGTFNGAANGVVNINGNLTLPDDNATIGRVQMTVSGTTTLATGRSLVINNNNGVKTFTGQVIINGTGTWTSTSVTTSGNLIFQNGILNNNPASGSFVAGVAMFSGNHQSLSGGGSFEFSGAVVISGAITLTNESTGEVTFNNTINGTDVASTFENDLNATVYYQPAVATQPMNTGLLDASAPGNSFYYSRAGAQSMKSPTIGYYYLYLTGSGIKTLTGNAGVDSDFLIANNVTFNPAGFDFSVAGFSTIYGTLADGTVAGTTTLQDVDLSGGTINNAAATGVVVVNGNLTIPTGDATVGRVTLTVNGSTTVPTGRSMTINNNTGVKSFLGAVTLNGTGTWTSTTVTTSGNLVFGNGITNNNTAPASFNAGGATFSTNNQSLSGDGAFTFNGAVTISGNITLTYEGLQTFTFNGILNGTEAGSTWRSEVNRVVYYQPNAANEPMAIGTLDVSANGNYFYYSRANAQNVKNPLTSYYHLIISGGAGTKTSVGHITVAEDFVLESGTSFNPAGFDFTVNGFSTITGTLADGTIAGTTTLQNVDLSDGTINGGANGVVNIEGDLTFPAGNATIGRVELTVNGSTTIESGRDMMLNSNFGSKTFIGTVTINGTGTWTSSTVTTAGNLVFQNGVTNHNATSGSFNAGGATFSTNNQSLSGDGAFTFGSAVVISGPITLTHASQEPLIFNGTLNGTDAGSTWYSEVNRIVYYQPNATNQPMATGILNLSAIGNYFYYSRNNAQSVKNPLTSYYYLIITGGAGTKTLIGDVNVEAYFFIETGATLNPAGFNLTVNGMTTITGTLADGTLAGTTTLQDVNLSGGTINGGANGVVEIVGNLTFPTADATIGRVQLTVNGTTTVSAARNLLLNSNNGTKTFRDPVTISSTATWNSSAVTTAGSLVFENGVINQNPNAGSFNGGGATFATNHQSISGAGAFSFGSAVVVSGNISVSNQSGQHVTLNGTLNGTVAGSTWINGVNSVTYYQPGATTQPMNIGVLVASAIGNTFHYSRNDAQNIKESTYYNLMLSEGGVKTASGELNILNDFTIQTTVSLNIASHNITVGNETLIEGSFTDNNNLGVNTFEGLVTISPVGSILTNNNSVFNFDGGIINDGIFNLNGTGTVNFLSTQEITGIAEMNIAGPVWVGADATVNYNNTNATGITLTGVLNGVNSASIWQCGPNTQMNYIQSVATEPMNVGTLLASGEASTFNYERAGDQNVREANYYNIILSGGGTKTLLGNINVTGDVNIEAVTFDVSASNFNIDVEGHWTNNGGTFVARNGIVAFSGTQQQIIEGGGSDFYNVEINNSFGGDSAILIASDLTILNRLELNVGVINTDTNLVVILNNNADAIASFNSNSYVYGNLRRYFAMNTDTYVFPVGNSYFQRADVANNNLEGITYIDARFSPLTNHDNEDLAVCDPELCYASMSPTGVWLIEPDVQPTNGTYNMYCYIGNLVHLEDNDFAILKRPAGSLTAADWTTGGGVINLIDGDGRLLADGYALRMGLTDFSEFGIGRGDGPSALPIELLHFDARYNDATVDVTWITATEINNSHFDVERSTNGVDFDIIATIEGAGNSSIQINYEVNDADVYPGIFYYRLKQTDFDDSYSYSKTVAVRVDAPRVNAEVSVYPNPTNGEVLNINLTGVQGSAVDVQIFDMTGKEVYSEKFNGVYSDSFSATLQPQRQLTAGIYHLEVVTFGTRITKTFVVER